MAEGLVLPATHLQLFISTWLQHSQLEGEREDTQVKTHLVSLSGHPPPFLNKRVQCTWLVPTRRAPVRGWRQKADGG